MGAFTPLDTGILVVYLIGITIWGAWLGRNQTGGKDYFLGSRELPWGAVLLSVVATETSALTFLSVPGVAYLGTLGFLQLALGYVVGRILVSLLFLPRYAQGEMTTAYALIDRRFGIEARRTTSGIFMVTRLLSDSVRLFATAVPLAILTGWPYSLSIAVIGIATVIYTYIGGVKAVIWTDVFQMGLYLLGALVTVVVLHRVIPGGWPEAISRAGAAGKLQWLDGALDLSVTYTIWAGLFGGTVFTMASHGTDQLLVQRLLTCKDLRSSQKALIGSGLTVFVQFLLFLMIGIGLWAFYEGRAFATPDAVFPTFIVEELPVGIRGLLIAAVFGVAMSSLSSSINALASASAYDFWAPARGAQEDDVAILRAGKVFTLFWSLLLIGGAILFIPLSSDTAAVEAALAVAGVIYGGLLGAFLLGMLSERADGRSVIIGVIAGIGFVAFLWVFHRQRVSWPWYVMIGSAITWTVGSLLGKGEEAGGGGGAGGRRRGPRTSPEGEA